MTSRAEIGEMDLLYVKINSKNIICDMDNSKAKIICVNDARISNDDAEEDQNANAKIYENLHSIFEDKFSDISKFEIQKPHNEH